MARTGAEPWGGASAYAAREPIAATDRARDARAQLTPAQLAWIAALPCALLTAAAVALLGPLVGHLAFAPHGERLWFGDASFSFGQPEPTKHGRFAVATLGPALLAATVLAGARRPPRLSVAATRALVTASQVLLVAAVALVTAKQWHVVYVDSFPPGWRIFTPRTLAVAGALVALALLALRARAAPRALARLEASSRAVRAICWSVAALATVVWLLPALTTDATVGAGPFPDLPPWAMGDTLAILDGRTPLVDFHAIYGQLWAYAAAVPMRALGETITVFSLVMVSVSALALLAVHATLRRVIRSPALALAAYLPLLATSLFALAVPHGYPLRWRMSNAGIYSVWPMRYAGPLLLLWLTARHLRGERPRRAWGLFLLAGLVVVNNLEFGVGALVATALALVCVPAAWSRAALRRLALEALAGLLGAALLVSALTLVRAGALPRFGLLLEFPRLFGVLGLAAVPMPAVGFHLAFYATFAAAIATAATRLARGVSDAALTGLLVWSGVFGLAAGSYFDGRSDPLKLAALMPAWSLALVLLLVVTVRALGARGWRRPAPAELLVLLGFALAVCSLAQLPSPWHEARRLEAAGAQAYVEPEAHALIGRNAVRGEHVAVVLPMGARIAIELGMVDVSPYALVDEIGTRRQWRVLLDAMRAGHAHKLFVETSHFTGGNLRLLERAGISLRGREGRYTYLADATVPRRGR